MSPNNASDGWCPFAIRKPVPAHKYWVGNKGRDAVVMHVSQGTIDSMVNWFLGGLQATAHFGIGPDGALYQFVSAHDSAFGNGASFRNGRWHDPDRPHGSPGMGLGCVPRARIRTGTPSRLKHAGPLSGSLDRRDAIATENPINDGLAEQFVSLAPYMPGKTLIGHCDISPVERKNCPGPHVDYGRIAATANGGRTLAVNDTRARVAPAVDIQPDVGQRDPGSATRDPRASDRLHGGAATRRIYQIRYRADDHSNLLESLRAGWHRSALGCGADDPRDRQPLQRLEPAPQAQPGRDWRDGRTRRGHQLSLVGARCDSCACRPAAGLRADRSAGQPDPNAA